MAPSGLDLGENIGRNRVMRKDIMFDVLWQGWSERWVVHKMLELVAKQRMAESSSMLRGDSRDGCGCNCSRYVGRSFGGSRKEAEDFSTMSSEEEDQRKLWLKRENSQAEWSSLFRLEREMDAALRFEHGDGTVGESKASPIWVTRILLGRLFCER